ncbi:T9SS type A sorting domain-containing protein [Polaribacter porphyrae]|uniref:Secretion system C-terminal sorting domain-containing protein n=1 Tax=Polaribacter porphyrae TaxID=1137780 RepID=A0A2S7WSQ7_9FLAO|nr:T9SS type A sorting domain-containing protein [Polaribacter porphyrae]PQJ80635.1 hypothetical protein BTO18_16275 [Polaribacter porphyrae]
MKKQLLLCLCLLITTISVAQTASIDTPPTPTTLEQGEVFTMQGDFDAGAGDSVNGNLAFVLRLYNTTDETFSFVANATVNKNGIQAENDVTSPNITVPATLTPSADLAANMEYRLVISYQRTVAGNFISTLQAVTITEGPNIKYTSLPTEVSSVVGGGLGKGALKTIVTWTNVTPGSTLFNQLRDHTGTQVGGFTVAVGTANGSAELNWGYFGGGTLVAGNVANIYSQYSGVSSIQQENIPVVNTITRWFGGTDTDWATTGNWDNGVPTASLKAVLTDVANEPIIAGSADVLDLTVQENSSLTMNAGSSLIVAGESSGNVTYNRTVNFVSGNLKGWYLMASPVAGQEFNDAYVTANDIAVSGSNRGISTYNTSGNTWSYLQGAASGTFNSGQGYSVKRQTNTGTVSFTGTINTSNSGVDFVLSNADDRFNALGNPYASYISSATLLGNAALSETQTIWVYNQTLGTNGEYEVKTFGDNFIIAPGQGFFVKANVAGGTVNFTEANQSHNADTFQKTTKTEVKLQISVDGYNNYTKLYYLENATKGFDVGYEGERFSASNDSFSIYTELLSDNIGKKYQVQSLPNSGFESMIVPVGVKAEVGKEITFSASASNLPSGTNVYLEDRANNTFTRLDGLNNNLKITLNEALNGTGRFYLHTKSSVLNTNDISLENVSIYKTNASTLKITGLSQGKSNVRLFNILGRRVMNVSFNSNGVKEISLPSLATGVYLVQLETEKGKLNKKIILE